MISIQSVARVVYTGAPGPELVAGRWVHPRCEAVCWARPRYVAWKPNGFQGGAVSLEPARLCLHHAERAAVELGVKVVQA